MNINIYSKDGEVVASVVVGSGSYVVKEIMGDNYLQLEFTAGEYIDIRRDAYVNYGGVKYTLMQAVNVEKISTIEYSYTARFESPQELLDNIIMCHMAGEDQVTTKAYERNFSLAGTAKEHLEMLWRNTDRLNINFTAPADADIDSSLTGVKVVAYNVVSCKSALQLIANQFECEWWVTGNETSGYTMHLGKCSFDESNPTKLAYGFDNGVLSGAKRSLHKDAQRMTHIAIQGGSQNINTLSQLTDSAGNILHPYKFATLHLPLLANHDENNVGSIYYDVKNNLFEGETGFSMSTAVLLTIDRDSNTMTSSLYDAASDIVVERAYDMSEYYPKKTRKVSAFTFQRNNREFYIEDSSIEDACNYKTYQLGGEKITIEFQTGALAGKSFDVVAYTHTDTTGEAVRRFECNLQDYDTISMPSVDEEMWRPAINDEFIVYGCALPKSYFADTSTDPYSGAEWDMCRRAASILCENFNDKYAYSLSIDSNWMSRRTEAERVKLQCGYWVHYIDSQLCGGGIDIRISSVKTYLTRPLQPELTIGDEVKTISVAQKLTQIASNVSATYNYVQSVQQETQQAIQKAEESKVENLQSDWEEEDTTSSAYIKNKPIIPEGSSVIDNLTSTSTSASLSANQGRVLKEMVDNKANKSHTHTWGEVTGKPTNVSAFTNDAGYLTEHQSLAEYTKKSDLPMDFAFASRFINTLTTGWLPVCDITLNPTYLCDTSTAVRIARYRYNNDNYVDTTIRIQLRFQSDSYWVAFVSSTSTKNYAYKYAYTINGNVVTIYTYINNDRYIMLNAFADDYGTTCTYTANTSSAVTSGVTEIVDTQTPAEVSVYCGLDYSATNKGLYVTINTLAYWNGLAVTGHSNLLYCDRGRFGTIVTKSIDDYALSGHTHNWSSITGKPDMDEYVKKTDIIANYFGEKTIDFGTSSVTLSLSDIKGIGRLRLRPNANPNNIYLPIPATEQEIANYSGHRLDVTIVPSNSEGRVLINASPYTLISSSSGIVTILTLVCTGTSWKALGFHV